MTITAQADSRIADANRAWQAACNLDITGWDTANEFIISTWAYSDLKNDDADLKLQWRRAGGTFTDVGADTEVCWGTNTVLIDAGNLLEANSAGCLSPWDSGTENEGDNASYASNIWYTCHWEGQWALGFGSGAQGNQEYEIQLVCITYSNSAICQTSITTAATGPPPGWNKLLYTSEPPTPNAWNQLKRDAGTGWKKLLFEGE